MVKMFSLLIFGLLEIKSLPLLMLQLTQNNSTKFIVESLKELTDGMLFPSMKENNINGKNPPLIFITLLSSKKLPLKLNQLKILNLLIVF
jgi:hypothetical protein